MSAEILRLIERFADLRVVVIGDTMLDQYIHGTAGRLSPEAPVPVVDVEKRTDRPGGAANVAANLAALGAKTSFIGVAGCDAAAVRVAALLDSAGVDVSGLVREPGRRTLMKARVVAGGHHVARIDEGSTCPISRESRRAIGRSFKQALASADLVVVSDYNYGVMAQPVIDQLARLRQRHDFRLAVDAKALAAYRDAGPDLVKPNYAQALSMLPGEPAIPGAERFEQVRGWQDNLLEVTGAAIAAVTLDSDGSLVLQRDAEPYRTYTRPALGSTAGAGDTYLAAFALALSAGATTALAADLAAAASAEVVERSGTAACEAADLVQLFSAQRKVVRDRDALRSLVEKARDAGKRIVFTNGCFDLVHRGHIVYLNQARALGDLLVVGINSDESVAALKGPSRPVQPLEARAEVLAAMTAVDVVVPFSERTPVGLIEYLRPDVFVKGGDYTLNTLPEAPAVKAYGGHVEILPYMEGFSTTGLIEQLRNGADHEASAGLVAS